jgi:hypothetical protein
MRAHLAMILGIVLIVVGMASLVVAVVLLIGASGLSHSVIASPSPGMVATAEGNGGSTQPTHTDPVDGGGNAPDPFGDVPTTPTVYLQQIGKTEFGTPDGYFPSYWKVWWNGASQQKAVVSVQGDISSQRADAAVVALDPRNRNPGAFGFPSTEQFTLSSTFDTPGIPGGHGYDWAGTLQVGGRVIPTQFRFAVFATGSNTELVSVTTYGGTVSPAQFNTFALAQYRYQPSSGAGVPEALLALVTLGLGVTLLITSGVRRRRASAAAAAPAIEVATWTQAVGAPSAPAYPPNWYPDPGAPEGSGALRYWDGFQWTPHTTPGS